MAKRTWVVSSLYRLRIALVLTAFVTYAYSITLTHFEYADNLGVFSSLSFLFYVSITLLLIAIVSVIVIGTGRGEVLVYAILIQLFFSLAGFLVSGPGGSEPNYVGAVGYMDATRFVAGSSIGSIIPHNAAYGGWPTSLSLYVMLFSITRTLSPSLVPQELIVGQVAFAILDTVLVFAIARALSGRDSQAPYLAVVLYAFGGHYVSAVLDDIGLSYTLFLTVVLVLVTKNRQGRTYMVFALLAIALSLANFYASLMMGAFVLSYGLISKRLGFPLVYSLALIGWLFFGFPSFYGGLVRFASVQILSFNLFAALRSASLIGSPSHHLIATLELVEYALFAGLASIAFLWELAKRTEMRQWILRLTGCILMMIMATVAFGPAFGTNPLESVERVYFLSFPIFAILIGLKWRRRLAVGILVLALLAPLSVVSIYGPVVPTYLSPAAQATGLFLQAHVSNYQFYALVPSYYNVLSPGINLYYFDNSSTVFRSTFTPVNSSQVGELLMSADKAIMTVGNSTLVYVQSYSGSRVDYTSTVELLNQASDLIFSTPDTQSFYI